MKIFDLTRGKYPQMYNGQFYLSKNSRDHIDSSEFQRLFLCDKRFNDLYSLLDEVPIFLVESSMAGEYIAVPKCQCSVQVPIDRYCGVVDDDFDIDDWVNSKEGDKKDDPRERTAKRYAICDMLGVYMSTGNNDVIPRRIFVWMDKIEDYAKKHTKNQKDIADNASALFGLILYHEIGHAVMGVELYGEHPAPNFSYSEDYVYRFIEEALANAIALNAIFDDLRTFQKSFIEDFVKGQGDGYSHGWFCYKCLGSEISQWMCIKVLFNYEFALLLKKFWSHKHFHDLECVKSVGRSGWIAVKGRDDKWGIMELPRQLMVKGFNRYNSFWSFDDNGLCMVRLDLPKGYAYGYVNEEGIEQIPVEYDYIYSFENGITVAKKEGKYGVIDLNNNIVVPFGLPYVDVRGFRNSRAIVKDSSGKWGVIDTAGNLIVPCTNDNIVL